jgi:hypothetical protein
LENLKERNATLQIQVLHLQEELNETQSKIRKAREMIKLYNKILKETMTANMKPHDLNYLQKVPRNREEENELLKVKECIGRKFNISGMSLIRIISSDKSRMFVFNQGENSSSSSRHGMS